MKGNVQAAILAFVLTVVSLGSFASSASTDHPGSVQDDSAIVSALRSRKGAYYVEGGNLVVSRLLPDDTSGLPHQKWEAKLSDGSTIQVVYNSDMGTRVPLQLGDRFAVGGQLLWLGNHGLIHWLHDDPRGQRPDGYVYLNGVVYGDTDHEDGSHLVP